MILNPKQRLGQSLLDGAAFDTKRIVLDSTSIAGVIKLLSEPVPTCFVAGTLVATADGHAAIDEIVAGVDIGY